MRRRRRGLGRPLLGGVLLAGLVSFGSASCSTVYVDQPAPPARVPPAPIPATQVDPGTTARERDELAVEAPPTVDERTSAAVSDDVVADFRRGYASRGKPRVALLMNRELSGRAEEWNVVLGATRGASSDEFQLGDKQTEPPERSWSSRETLDGEVVNVTAGRADDGSRRSPGPESWTWRFAQGFQETLLEVPVTLVDRATIVRLGAASEASSGPEYATLATKKVEIDALRTYADLYVEVLVTRDPPPAGPFLFRATATSVGAGTLLATVTRPASELGDARYVATVDGYARAPVAPEAAGQGLAEALMAALAKRWR